MNPLAALLAQLGYGRALGPYDVVPNFSAGAGIPATMGVGSALPGMNYSPNALQGPSAGGSTPGTATMSDPAGMATGAGSGVSGLGPSPFLNGALFNLLFPSGAPSASPQASPSTGLGSNTSLSPAPTGTAGLFDMAAGLPTSGGTSGGGGDVGTAAPGESGGSAIGGPFSAGFTSPIGTFGSNIGGINNGLGFAGLGGTTSQGALGQGVNALTDSSTLGSLANFAVSLFGGPYAGLANSLIGMALTNGQNQSLQNAMNLGMQTDFGLNPDLNAPPANDPTMGGSVTFGMPGNVGGRAPGANVGNFALSLPGAVTNRGDDTSGAPPGVTAETDTTSEGATASGVAPDTGQTPTTTATTDTTATGEGGGAGGSGSGAASLLCNYALRNGSYDGTDSTNHRRAFGALAERAFREHPGLKDSFGHYQEHSRNIIDKIDTQEPGARKVSLADLHTNLVQPFAAAAKGGDVKGAARILRAQTVRLAKQHGVTIPPAHLAASEQHLGPLGAS